MPKPNTECCNQSEDVILTEEQKDTVRDLARREGCSTSKMIDLMTGLYYSEKF